MRAFALALPLLLAASASRAYTHVVQPIGAGLVRLRWPPAALPLRVLINNQTGPGLTNVTDDSAPRAAISRALAAWPVAANLEILAGTTNIESGGQDGVNVISFAPSEANGRYFEMAGEPVGLTLYFFDGEALTEADVLFNPRHRFTTTAGSDGELRSREESDIEAVTVHELGHAIGLNHSGVESASMWAFSSLAQRHLDNDDVVGAQVLYPSGDGATLVGEVQVGGEPAFGAHVVAVSAAGPLYSALTLPDGTYRIEHLPPGPYTAYVEPLDGPHASAFGDGCVRFGNMGGAGIFDGAELTTTFATTFYGAQFPVELTLSEGHSVLVSFDLPAANPSLNPIRIGAGTASGGFERFAEFPLAVGRGRGQWVAVAGAGLDRVPNGGIRVAGAGVTVDPNSISRLSVTCGEETLPALVFAVGVSAGAATGGRTLLFERDGELAAFTGALRIVAETSPACAGDCNEDGLVTVDELLLAVGIALGEYSFADCPRIDTDDDQRATIAELVAGVKSILSGCT